MRRRIVALLALTLSVCAFGEEAERPWARGVSKDAQAQAIALFKDGNGALKDSLFPAAVAKYREALKHWDHPAVHYNLALALVNLDQPIEVHEHLTAALKFGAAPLDDDKYQQAQRYLALIDRQLTKVQVSTSVVGASVKLDGKQLFVGPGNWEGPVRAGQHTLTASKDGFLPDERALTFGGGDTQTFDMRVFREEELMEYSRPFPAAIPWATLGVGIAAAGTGLGLHLAANENFKQYDKNISACANGSNDGCAPGLANNQLQLRTGGESMQTAGIAMYAVGGAAIATSIVLFVVGKPVATRKTVTIDASKITVVPLLSPNGAGAMASLEF